MNTSKSQLIIMLALTISLTGAAASAGGLTVSIDPPGPQPVGTEVTLTVTGDTPDPVDFRLLVRKPGGELRVVYDFSPRTQYRWAALEQGAHFVRLEARDLNTGAVTPLSSAAYLRLPIAVTQPVISPTNNPLVALYSAPGCQTGNQHRTGV